MSIDNRAETLIQKAILYEQCDFGVIGYHPRKSSFITVDGREYVLLARPSGYFGYGLTTLYRVDENDVSLVDDYAEWPEALIEESQRFLHPEKKNIAKKPQETAITVPAV